MTTTVENAADTETISYDYRLVDVTLVLDWSYESSIALKNFIEAKKILLLDYMVVIHDRIIEIENTCVKVGFLKPPILAINGEVISQGKALTADEIVNVILCNDYTGISKLVTEFLGIESRPAFSSVEVVN